MTGVAPLEVRSLGVVEYGDALALQRTLVEQRQKDAIPDQLLLLEHPHVITLGVRTADARGHIVVGEDELSARGVAVFEAGRGGDVTYHGPGQLVAYPILALPAPRRDLHRYVRDLEEVLIQALRTWDIDAGRVPGLTGVWVGQEKIAAIGVRVSRWVTSHGIALNVTTDLSCFGLIVPCGIADKGVTSIERVLGRRVEMAEAEAAFAASFRRVFGYE